MIPGKKLRIGDILIECGLIRPEQLEEALKKQDKASGEFLGAALIRLGFVSERDLAVNLSRQMGIPFFSMDNWPGLQISAKKLTALIPETFLRKYCAVLVERRENTLIAVLADPTDVVLLDNIQKMTRLNVETAIGTRTDIQTVLNQLFSEEGALKSAVESFRSQFVPEVAPTPRNKMAGDLSTETEKAPVVQLVNLILDEAIRFRASDIHLEPYERSASIRFRIDGVLKSVPPPDKIMFSSLVSRLKILSNMDIGEKRLPQDGSFTATIKTRTIDFRVSTIPTIYGEKMVMRILDRASARLDLAALGFAEEELKIFRKAIEQPSGLILITGPTGSGKTTTLYSALNELRGEDVNITTVEDPVEYQLEGINQVQVKSGIGLTFASALRSFLRQDPDIILVGETRDLETAQICIRSSLTGHLVFSSLHTNDAIASVNRLIDIGVEPFLVATSLSLVVAQRLMRNLCPKCKKEWMPEAKSLPRNFQWDGTTPLYVSVGCVDCADTGFRGRSAIYEVASINDKMRELITNRASMSELRAEATRNCCSTLERSAFSKVLLGKTSLEEALRTILTREE